MTNQESKKIAPIYFENLDALRFLAALSVFIFHFFRDINGFYPNLVDDQIFKVLLVFTNKGSLGVNFFFVLSGFLITYLILQEKRSTNHFSLWKFLVRRTLRIWPLYFIIVLLGFVLFPLILENFQTSHNPILYLFFLANFDEIYNTATDTYNFLTAPWSVAVEEQFYLIWSLLLFPLLKIKSFRLEYLIAILYLLSFLFSWLNRDNHSIIYYHTFSVCQDILTGAFFGLSLFNGRMWLKKIISMKRYQVILIYIIGFGFCVLKTKLFAGDLIVFERLVLSIFFGFIIIEQSQSTNSLYKIGRLKFLTFLGKISYGFYMYHLIVLFFVSNYLGSSGWHGWQPIVLYFLIALPLTVLVSVASFYCIEKPLLKLKPKSI